MAAMHRLMCLGFCSAALISSTGHAQEYPTRPIRFIVGFSAGGPADIVTRVLGQKLAEAWGQQVVVDNRPGAGGNIAGEIVSKAASDGHTLYMANIGHAVNPSLYRKLPFDAVKHFTPVILVAAQPLLLTVNLSVPVKSVGDLIALAKVRPGQLNFASAGNGTGGHLAGELFKSVTGVKIVHIPYKGSPPAIADLLSGHVQMMFDGLPSALPHARAGKSRALGVSSARRSEAAPDIPTIAESGVLGYEAYGWNGVLAPAGVSVVLVAKINREIARVLELSDVKKRLGVLGFETKGGSAQEFVAFMHAEMQKWGKVVREAGIRAD